MLTPKLQFSPEHVIDYSHELAIISRWGPYWTGDVPDVINQNRERGLFVTFTWYTWLRFRFDWWRQGRHRPSILVWLVYPNNIWLKQKNLLGISNGFIVKKENLYYYKVDWLLTNHVKFKNFWCLDETGYLEEIVLLSDKKYLKKKNESVNDIETIKVDTTNNKVTHVYTAILHILTFKYSKCNTPSGANKRSFYHHIFILSLLVYSCDKYFK